MYSIEKKLYGYKISFAEHIAADEMAKWVEESKKMLAKHPAGDFGVFVDMRTLKPLSPDAQAVMVSGQKLFREKGMKRSVVILNSATVTLQFKRLAQESGIYAWERYIDASRNPDFERIGVDWIQKGTDPDAKGG